MFYLIYQDYENGPKYLSSSHRTLAGAEKAKARHLADRFYSAYIFSISTKKPV